MRLDPEVAAAAHQLQKEHHIGLGDAVNMLAQAGLERMPQVRKPFVQRTVNVGIKVDITNVADTLERLDEYDRKDNL